MKIANTVSAVKPNFFLRLTYNIEKSCYVHVTRILNGREGSFGEQMSILLKILAQRKSDVGWVKPGVHGIPCMVWLVDRVKLTQISCLKVCIVNKSIVANYFFGNTAMFIYY